MVHRLSPGCNYRTTCCGTAQQLEQLSATIYGGGALKAILQRNWKENYLFGHTGTTVANLTRFFTKHWISCVAGHRGAAALQIQNWFARFCKRLKLLSPKWITGGAIHYIFLYPPTLRPSSYFLKQLQGLSNQNVLGYHISTYIFAFSLAR